MYQVKPEHRTGERRSQCAQKALYSPERRAGWPSSRRGSPPASRGLPARLTRPGRCREAGQQVRSGRQGGGLPACGSSESDRLAGRTSPREAVSAGGTPAPQKPGRGSELDLVGWLGWHRQAVAVMQRDAIRKPCEPRVTDAPDGATADPVDPAREMRHLASTNETRPKPHCEHDRLTLIHHCSAGCFGCGRLYFTWR